jgi:5'-AMP-activated protein kinase catalytic alpha subunit
VLDEPEGGRRTLGGALRYLCCCAQAGRDKGYAQAPALQANLASHDPLQLSDELLGEGATAKVWKGTYGSGRIQVAAKVVLKQGMDAQELQWIRDEIAMHALVGGASQTREDACRHICELHTSMETPESITLVLQLCRGGSLVDTMLEAADERVPLPEGKVQAAFRQLLDGLLFCASLGVAHRDVKLANGCWVDAERTWLVLTDFGYASATDEHSVFAGSAHYAAPEVHRCDHEATVDSGVSSPAPYSAAAADVWSAGVCLYAMLATALPFNGDEESADERRALRAKVYAGAWDAPLLRTAPAKELVRAMLTVDHAQRITLNAARAHKWLNA